MSSRSQKVQHILLVDDSENDRASVRAALLQGAPGRRFHFYEASRGEEGLAICQSEQVDKLDCAIVDMDMPGISGNELLRELTDESGVTSIPVVVLTGSMEDDVAGESLRLGAQDYVTKDAIYPTVLFRIVDNAIHRHAMTKRLHDSERAADAANRAKSSLIGSISHEIRTPMTAVLGLAELLLESHIDDDQRDLLEMIRDNGAYLVEIVNDLLDLSKMEANMLVIEPHAVSLADLAGEVIQLMEVRAKDNNTDLQARLSEDLPDLVMADSIRLRQILFNLLSNAIKFTPNGKVAFGIEATDSAEGKQLCFSVADTGCGIEDDELSTIFEPFTQATNNRRQNSRGGTGLGLSICKRLASAMGGNIEVESTPGQGSCFRLRLPLTLAEKVNVVATGRRRELRRTIEENLKDCRVLVAEDTPATQVLMTRFIEAAGGNVSVVDNGQKLIDSVTDRPEDVQVVVTDVQMPIVDGLEATRQIRTIDSKLPIMVLTADAFGETRESALAAGANEVLTKPIDRNEFLEALAHLCELANESEYSNRD